VPAQSEWYYSHDQAKGLGLIVNIMSLDSATDVNVTVDFGSSAIDSSAFDGVLLPFPPPPPPTPTHYTHTLSPSQIVLLFHCTAKVHGAIRRALLAKANTDMDRWVADGWGCRWRWRPASLCAVDDYCS
jgi:hypothetical protein